MIRFSLFYLGHQLAYSTMTHAMSKFCSLPPDKANLSRVDSSRGGDIPDDHALPGVSQSRGKLLTVVHLAAGRVLAIRKFSGSESQSTYIRHDGMIITVCQRI